MILPAPGPRVRRAGPWPTARTVQRSTGNARAPQDRTTPHTWLVDIRVFFADISTWATEPDSPFAGHAPSSVVLTRHDLADTGFAKARERAEARLTSTVLDLQREIPNIRAFALRRWHDAEQALREDPDDKTLIAAERAAFWDWALLELLLQRAADRGGVRADHASTSCAARQRDGRATTCCTSSPAKFDRARVIPIGDGLGRVIAEIIRHVKAFYGTDARARLRRRDEHEKRPLPGRPTCSKASGHPSASRHQHHPRPPAPALRKRAPATPTAPRWCCARTTAGACSPPSI